MSVDSGYFGVYWLEAEKSWCCLGFKGLFKDAAEAAVYFDVWNIENYKGYPLNFKESLACKYNIDGAEIAFEIDCAAFKELLSE